MTILCKDMNYLVYVGVMGLDVYIAYECGLLMVWTKCVMTKVVIKERVYILCYEVCGLMSGYTWKCYDLLSMLCQV